MAHTSEHADHSENFVTVFIAVFVALTIFTLVCVFVARALGKSEYSPDDALLRADLVQRIAPVGAVNTSADQIAQADAGDAPAATVTETVADSGDDADGIPARVKTAVDGVCIACHMAGVGGAPKIGDQAAWAERSEKGVEAMAAVVVTGKGAMPARGGSDLSDEELIAAVEYMLSK